MKAPAAMCLKKYVSRTLNLPRVKFWMKVNGEGWEGPIHEE